MTLDWNSYIKTAKAAVSEGCVLLKNDDHALPLEKGCRVSVFGRIQLHYYKSGMGSGGLVNVSKVIGILEGLRESNWVQINEKLVGIYEEWEQSHPFDGGTGWGEEPWSQEEMPLTEEIVASAAMNSDTAIVIIGRSSGEDKDITNAKGSYLLTDIEEDMLEKVCSNFNKTIVILNVGNIIDMNFVDKYNPTAVLYGWQGGMVGGSGIADVLTGVVSPSGKLTDTIAYDIRDYPAYSNFGDDNRNIYMEDIYVGYRYFETFAAKKVQYPFGYGLSYTTFDVKTICTQVEEDKIHLTINVANTGNCCGKETVQIYICLPQGKLGKPRRTLIAFQKTKCLAPNEKCELQFHINMSVFASYDDMGATGHKSCFVLEEGKYDIYIGTDVRNAVFATSFNITTLRVTEKLESALSPKISFERYKPAFTENGDFILSKEMVIPTGNDTIDLKNLPQEIAFTGNKGIRLQDVKTGKASMSEFIAQFTEEELSCIIRGEGMGSPKVTAGTAAAFGGISPSLIKMGIPAVCCDDGPSGLRLDCGTKAFSLPNETMLACTFNPELITQLFAMTAMEMAAHKIDCLLDPGMNIHRYPLNGRNFEYFSEDPYLTGIMASAVLNGLHQYNAKGTIKHFCGNNQEKRRFFVDSVISERALREIYLRGFEMAVKIGKAKSIMTTYGFVNQQQTGQCYDLTTTILRKEWGFDGIVMTDWYDSIDNTKQEIRKVSHAKMTSAQNDLYMVCSDGSKTVGEDTLYSLENRTLTKAELQRNAANICRFIMDTSAMKRLIGENEEIKIINQPSDDENENLECLEYVEVENEMEISLTDKVSVKGCNYLIAFELKHKGLYSVSLCGSSTLSKLAQIPCTLFLGGIPVQSFTFSGTSGENVFITKDIFICSKYALMRLYVGQNGVKLKNICFKLKIRLEDIPLQDRPDF